LSRKVEQFKPLVVGPIQPINAELAVEVAYPEDENAIVALQQVGGAAVFPDCLLIVYL